jgi:hypothetical protein
MKEHRCEAMVKCLEDETRSFQSFHINHVEDDTGHWWKLSDESEVEIFFCPFCGGKLA